MQRTFIGGISLLLGGAIFTPVLPVTTPLSAVPGKTETLFFVFRGLDQAENVAILRPMIAPDIGVQLGKGPTRLERGAVLQCQPLTREHDALIDGQISKISELVLVCGDRQFVVKGLDFTQRLR
jgi:hypothetical protein